MTGSPLLVHKLGKKNMVMIKPPYERRIRNLTPQEKSRKIKGREVRGNDID